MEVAGRIEPIDCQVNVRFFPKGAQDQRAEYSPYPIIPNQYLSHSLRVGQSALCRGSFQELH